MDQLGKVANPARDQMNRENEYLLVRVRDREFGLEKQTGSSAVSSRVSLLSSILRLNLVLTHGIPPEFRGVSRFEYAQIVSNISTCAGRYQV